MSEEKKEEQGPVANASEVFEELAKGSIKIYVLSRLPKAPPTVPPITIMTSKRRVLLRPEGLKDGEPGTEPGTENAAIIPLTAGEAADIAIRIMDSLANVFPKEEEQIRNAVMDFIGPRMIATITTDLGDVLKHGMSGGIAPMPAKDAN